ncbi:MAG TPA: Uma2 family endonuclease [Bryobacteraceae bacterium]|nr:Uma2 family endonuclease [Bryobacteraceae bacterium]
MSSLAHSLVTWAEFLRLPERPETGKRYELHDGEVVLVPPARPLHIKLQKRIERLLEAAAGGRGVVAVEFPYRPVPNLQYWFADVAFVLQADWDALPPNEYPVYAPALIVEVLSPSNTPAKVNRQRIVAMSAGTQEFWVVDAESRTAQVTDFSGTKVYAAGSAIPLPLFGGGTIAVDEIFAS